MIRLLMLMTVFITSWSASAATESGLNFKVYSAGESSFNVNSTLVYGEKEAAIIDTGFTKADALRIAANVYDSGKTLKFIFISQADPDYYFGAEQLHKIFPNVKILTTPAVQKVIKEKLAQKVAFWGPKMGTNAPETPIVPDAINSDSLTVDGHTIEVHGTKGVLAYRPYLWVPSNKAILGNVSISGGSHLWLADTASMELQTAWLKQLKEIQLLKPEFVVPGHMVAGTPFDASSIDHSLNYLNDFITARKESHNSQELINKMTALYPNLPGAGSLELGAKVVMGEMQW